ncbi:MAG: hypothetical protein JO295_03700 [Verrucomicrobia bacterium]|nr:hypothetical protein [Verrucomicrobiota bacterium]
MRKQKRKNKPGAGRPPEGRVKMTIHVVPACADLIRQRVGTTAADNTTGKIIERQFGLGNDSKN